MAQFSELITAVNDQFGDSSTAMNTRIKRYINWSQQDVCSRHTWDFLLKRSFFQCTDDYTTGTVDATNGSATITGTSTVFTSGMVGRKIRVGTDSEFYTIATFTSTTSIDLDQTYVGSTVTGKTYAIYQDEYSLATDVEKIIDLYNPTLAYKLKNISRQEFDALIPNPQSYGNPEYWIEAGRDSSENRKVQVYLIPDSTYVIYYWYRKELSDLSADTDTSSIPAKYHKLLYLGGIAQCYEYDNDPQANNYWAQYENMLEAMKGDYGVGSEDSVLTLRSIDSGIPNKLRLPPGHFEN